MGGVLAGVLGQFTVEVEGEPRSVTAPKQRAVLALLALNANRVVSVASLLDGVWGEPVPDRAERTLQQHVSTIRKLLDAGPERAMVLETRSPGYLLHVDRLDADDFAADADEGKAAAARGDWATALEAFDRALARWRGPALADARDTPRLAAAAARLDEQRLAVVEVRFEAALACGQAAELVADLELLLDEHPLRERLHAHLMLALYRSGRQAEALLAYQSARRVLVDELGIEPGAELRNLENEILLQSPLLDLGPAGPTRSSTAGRSSARTVDVPRQPRLDAAIDPAFAGRRTQLDLLGSALDAVRSGERRVVLLDGEPGVGKTALAAAFAAGLTGQPIVVAYGRSDEDLGLPYQAWTEAIDHLARHAPADLLEGHLASRGGAIRTLASSLAEPSDPAPPTSEDREAERYLLFNAVEDLLERWSAVAPVLLILDDLHWADRQSLQLLRHVIVRSVGRRLLVIGTFRDTEVDVDHPLGDLLADLRREQGVDRVSLTGLDPDELLTMLESTAGHELDEGAVALRDALAAETDGNPFLVGEMLRHLIESGDIIRDEAGRWTGSADIGSASLPASVREVVTRRVARLGREASGVLALASVIGRDFDLAVLARVVELDGDQLIEALDGAIRAAVVSEAGAVGRFTFAHALVARTLYDAQSSVRRSHAHTAVAEALEALCGDDLGDRVGEVAFHWARADREPAKAIGYAALAGDRALQRYAPDEAARWYRSAIDLLDAQGGTDVVGRARLLVGLGEAQRQSGDPEYRRTLLTAGQQADQGGDADLLAAAAIANTRGWASSLGEVDEERVAVLRRALDAIGPRPSEPRALLLATLCAEVLFGLPFEERWALGEEAVAVARAVGDDATLLEVLVRIHESIVAPPSLARRLEWTAEACELGDRVGNPALRLSAHIFRYLATLEACDGETARRSLAVAAAEADHIGQPTHSWSVAVLEAMAIAVSGDLEAAEAASLRAFELGTRAGQADAFGGYGMQVLSLRWMQGRLHEVMPLLSQVSSDFDAVAAMRSGLALGYSESGDLEAAGALLAEEHRAGFERGVASGWLASHAMWALVACTTGNADAAAALYGLLEPYADHFMSTHITAYGPVAYPLGRLARLLGRDHDALVHFERAHDLNVQMGSTYFLALTDAAWAEALAASGRLEDRERSRALAEAAEEAAVAGGYGDIRTRAGLG